MKRTTGLTTREEKLLNRYHDGECGFLGKIIARWFLRRYEPARDYLASLNGISCFLSDIEAPYDEKETDLWQKIERRIFEEEKIARFYGNRLQKIGIFSTFRERIGYGLSGALLAAACAVLVFVVMPGGYEKSLPNGTQNANGVDPATLVSLSNKPSSFYGIKGRSAPDVDWVRSDGHVRVINNPDDQSTIMWVRKREPRIVLERNTSGVIVYDKQNMPHPTVNSRP